MKRIFYSFLSFILFTSMLLANEDNCHKDVVLRKEWKEDNIYVKQEKHIDKNITIFVSKLRNEIKFNSKEPIFIKSIKIYNLHGQIVLYDKIEKYLNPELIYPFSYSTGIYFVYLLSSKEEQLFSIIL